MGIFDSFLGDVHKEIRQAATLVNTVKSGAGKVVSAIDAVEDKVTNLPTEEAVKQKLKQSLQVSQPAAPKDDQPAG